MVEKNIISSRNGSGRNVIDFLDYRFERSASRARAMVARACRHCGASLLDGESDDDCSSVSFEMVAPPRRRFYVE